MTILISIFAAFAVMLVSLSGVVFASRKVGAWMTQHLTYLATFSAGVLGVLAYHLVEESLHEGLSLPLAAAAVVCGIIVLEIVHRLIPNAHHHHEATAHGHSSLEGRRLLISDGVHNITDGFLIVSAFLADWRIGVGATLGIMLHETVQEISEYLVLRHAGYTHRAALSANFVSSSTILIGVALATFLASSESFVSLIAALAAGGFLSVVLRDLIPHAVYSARASGRWAHHGGAFVLGTALMLALSIAVSH